MLSIFSWLQQLLELGLDLSAHQWTLLHWKMVWKHSSFSENIDITTYFATICELSLPAVILYQVNCVGTQHSYLFLQPNMYFICSHLPHCSSIRTTSVSLWCGSQPNFGHSDLVVSPSNWLQWKFAVLCCENDWSGVEQILEFFCSRFIY